MLINIDEHCSVLDLIFQDVGPRWRNVSEWLQVAAAVKRVELDTIRFNDEFGFCSMADVFDLAREQLLADFVTNLTRFSFVWGALECALDEIGLTQDPAPDKRGKISTACIYLTCSFDAKPLLPHYLEEVADLKSSVAECPGYDNVTARFSPPPHIGPPGVGLYSVYKVRNLFAHGSLAFPLPNTENRPIARHSPLVSQATRLVLFSLQMLFIALFKTQNIYVKYRLSQEFEPELFPLDMVLRNCHLIETSGISQLYLPPMT
jgi:hypothetical protein